MGNCLVTKLKGTVDNPSLRKLGEIVLHAHTVQNDDLALHAPLQFGATGVIKVNLPSGGSLGTSLEDLNNNPKTYYEFSPGEGYTLYFSNGNYDIHIEDNYGLTKLHNNTSNVETIVSVDLAELKYRNNFNHLRCFNSVSSGDIANLVGKPINYLDVNFNTHIYGDIANLAGFTGLTTLGLIRTSVEGNISSIAHLINLTSMGLGGSKVTGTVESFVAGQVNAGRTTATSISSQGLLATLTFGGNKYETDMTAEFISWESASKIFIFVGSSSNPTTIYCKGYTQGDAEAKWPGKTVVRVDA